MVSTATQQHDVGGVDPGPRRCTGQEIEGVQLSRGEAEAALETLDLVTTHRVARVAHLKQQETDL